MALGFRMGQIVGGGGTSLKIDLLKNGETKNGFTGNVVNTYNGLIKSETTGYLTYTYISAGNLNLGRFATDFKGYGKKYIHIVGHLYDSSGSGVAYIFPSDNGNYAVSTLPSQTQTVSASNVDSEFIFDISSLNSAFIYMRPGGERSKTFYIKDIWVSDF